MTVLLFVLCFAAGAAVMHRIDGHRSEAGYWVWARYDVDNMAADRLVERNERLEATCRKLTGQRDWARREARKGIVVMPKVKADPNVLPPSAAILPPKDAS